MKDAAKPQYSIWKNLRYAWKLSWKHSKILVLFTLGTVLSELLINIIQLYIAPVVLGKVEQSVPLAELFGTIALFTFGLLICNSANSYLQSTAFVGRLRLRHGLTTEMISHSCMTAYENTLDTGFQEKQSGAFDLTSDDNNAIGQMPEKTIRLITALIGFLLYLMVLQKLPAALLVVVTVTAVLSYLVGRNTDQWNYNYGEKSYEIQHRKNYFANLVMANEMPKDIRIFGMQPWLDDVWQKTLDCWKNFCSIQERKLFAVKVVDTMLAFARNGIAYGYLIYIVLHNGLSASEFLLYFSAVTGFTNWITLILNNLSDLHKISLQICRYRQYLEWPEPFQFEGGKSVRKNDFDHFELRLEQVSYRYPQCDRDTISHMNLTIHSGEKLAIVGLNGAGKTTLIKLLCGFLDPTEGRVLLNGQDIRELNRRDYYQLITGVFQDFSQLQVSIAQNVAQRISDIDSEHLAHCVAQAGLTQAIETLPKGLDTTLGRLLNDDGTELSGGQLQRLMLARALYKDAPILLLDEPTAALDPIAENDIYQKYNEMTAGKTSVFISHRLASTRFCDRILFLESGTIKEEGTHDQLLKLGGAYAKLFAVQAKYYQEGVTEDEV